MSKAIMLISTQQDIITDQINLSLIQSLQQNKKLAVFKPINTVQSDALNNAVASLPSAKSISLPDAQNMLANNQLDMLLEQIVGNYQDCAAQADTVLIIGLNDSSQQIFANKLNQSIAQTLAAKIILVSEANTNDQLAITYNSIDTTTKAQLVAFIIQGQADKAKLPIIANISTQDTVAQIAAKLTGNTLNLIARANNEQVLMTPPVFRHKLTVLARKANKRIVLPEGDEPRTIRAAAICGERKIATCVLLADPANIKKVAAEQGVILGEGIEIIDPASIRNNYVTRFVELRKSKGLTEQQAIEQLQDNVVLGTLMLENGEVDGLVSGAVHSTANTIRPPLQLIKTAANNPTATVSSIFFMLMPEQVYVYGDCAVCPDPTVEQLAGSAIQSADNATAFGIEARVAMLSYSTGNSGAGAAVDKVVQAIKLVKQQRPDILIDGPLQYDAAVMPDIAKSKAPNSPVAGKATVFIFPDLNAGNITYKAVQRSANLVSIGPMLQGMRKPVNDLSRGALIDDIVYTIALTAIQAAQ